MLPQHNVNINGTDYIINPFKGRQGWIIQSKLAKIALPAIQAAGVNLSDESNMLATIVAIAKEVLDCIEGKDSLALVEELLSLTYKGTMKVDFDTEFALNYSSAYKLLKEVIQFNFKDVFSMLGTDAS